MQPFAKPNHKAQNMLQMNCYDTVLLDICNQPPDQRHAKFVQKTKNQTNPVVYLVSARNISLLLEEENSQR